MDQEIRRSIEICHKHGLHLRPAAEVVRIVRQYKAEVRLLLRGAQAHTGSVFDLLLLGAACGDEVEIAASGHDAEAAMNAVHAYLETWGRGEDEGGVDLDSFAA